MFEEEKDNNEDKDQFQSLKDNDEEIQKGSTTSEGSFREEMKD